MAGHNGNGNGKNGNGNAKWTIMVYIAADSTLANFAVQCLQQLQAAATAEVVVAAQFGSDGERDIPRLIFDGCGKRDGSLKQNKKDEIARDTDMGDPTSLSDFIDWVCEQPQCSDSNHWCLVLWGHGPELLFDDYVAPATHKDRKSFLTPSALGKALQHTRFNKNQSLDIVAIDACCMSMVEVAYELRPYAKFLVASQEEVPDFSFPYGRLLPHFQENATRHTIASLCEKLTKGYISSYQDYILTQQAQTQSITLASIRLESVPQVTRPLKTLARILLESAPYEEQRQAIVEARANSKGFVAGLYTDLYDFCEQLRSRYNVRNIADADLIRACKEICAAIRSRDEQACVIASEQPQDMHCHGLSIYFPYFTDDEQVSLSNSFASFTPLVKGGIDVLQKGGIDVLQKGGIDVLQKGMDVLNTVRRQRIEETEAYYDQLMLSQETCWGEFITHGWSRCLAEDAADKAKKIPKQSGAHLLDQRYSAQQCALNLLSLCQKLEGAAGGRKEANGLAHDELPPRPPKGEKDYVNGNTKI